MNNDKQKSQEFEEIDFIEIAIRLWQKRKFVIKVTGTFIAMGLLIALFSPEEYTSECVMVPQTSSGLVSSSSGVGSLAKLAGISLGDVDSEETISPMVYSNVLKNINFQKELIYTPLYFEEYDREITLIDYFTSEEYQKFSLKKYTIGLPGLIMKSMRGEETERTLPHNLGESLQFYTNKEMECVEKLEQSILLEFEDADGYVTLRATMPEAILSTQLVMRVQSLLQKYITEFKIEKALISYNFVKERYEEAKIDFEAKQKEYAKFKDSNKLLTSAMSQIKEMELYTEYTIASSTFDELALQLVKSELKVKEDTPTFTIIEPAKVPNRRSAPRRSLILVIFTLFGGIVACGMVLFIDHLKSLDVVNIKYLNNWK